MMPPGTILQLMHVQARIKRWPASYTSFYEVGSGVGLLSQLFLQAGYSGCGYDLNVDANKINCNRNKDAIRQGRYAVEDGNFLLKEDLMPVDFVVSSMVIEHMSSESLDLYLTKALSLLKPGGRIVTLVPANPRAWGIEDEIAGHVKRFERSCFYELAKSHNMQIIHMKGLTWPLSNLLLPASNYFVRRNESSLLKKSMFERTVATGNRSVPFKTNFPSWVSLFVNQFTLSPFYLLQLMSGESKSCLVLYCEMCSRFCQPKNDLL